MKYKSAKIKTPTTYVNLNLKWKRKRMQDRLNMVDLMLQEHKRHPQVLKVLRAEFNRLTLEAKKLDEILLSDHLTRPDNLRKGNNWVCKCGAINIYEHAECKMVLIEKQNVRATKPKKQEKDIAAELNLKSRERITDTMPADFFDFLGD